MQLNILRLIGTKLGVFTPKQHLPELDHQQTRDKKLKIQDELSPIDNQVENDMEEIDEENDPLLIEIRKSAKSMEIIGQILRNQYGSLKKNILKELFEEGQNIGLRLLRSFIELMNKHYDNLYISIERELNKAENKKNEKLSKSEIESETKKIIANLSYYVILSWMYKIVDSIGYDKLIEIADSVNKKTDTVASKLINLSIHTWYGKKLDIKRIQSLYTEFDKDNNYQAIYILKNIVIRHIYMHPVKYDDRHKLRTLLKLSVKKQQIAQSKIDT